MPVLFSLPETPIRLVRTSSSAPLPFRNALSRYTTASSANVYGRVMRLFECMIQEHADRAVIDEL